MSPFLSNFISVFPFTSLYVSGFRYPCLILSALTVPRPLWFACLFSLLYFENSPRFVLSLYFFFILPSVYTSLHGDISLYFSSYGRFPLFLFLLPPRWPGGCGVRLESGSSGVRIPLGAEIFPGSSHTNDLNIGTPVATLPVTWRYRVSGGTGRPGVSIL